MSNFPQEIVKRLPQFKGSYVLPEESNLSEFFSRLHFFLLNNPIFFPKLLDKLSKTNFSEDFLFSFINGKEDSYFSFMNQNYIILIDEKYFDNISDTIASILSKSDDLCFIPLNNKDEGKISKIFPSIQFKFKKIQKVEQEIISDLLNQLFPKVEIINYTIFTKITCHFFSTQIILSQTNPKFIESLLTPDLEYEIGLVYEKYGNKANDSTFQDIALKYYLRSSEKNNSESAVRIGLIYEKRKENEEALKWYKKSHFQKNPEGQYRLCLLQLNDSNISNQEIFDYLKKSAEKGNVDSQMLLGSLFNGNKKYSFRKIERNIANSFYYYLLAAENGNKEAYKKTLSLYKEDKNDVIFDSAMEIRFLKICADNDSTEEQYKLGCIYENDSVVKKNLDKAIYYLEKASDKDHIESQLELGLLLHNILKNSDYRSIPCLKNTYKDENLLMKRVKGLLTSAAQRGNCIAQHNLGLILLDEKSLLEANYYFNMAAEQNYPDSQYQVGLLYMKSSENTKKIINRALNYLKSSASNNYIKAYVRLGDIYSDENSGAFNMEDAIENYKKAADSGDAEAQTKLGKIYSTEGKPYYNMQNAINYFGLACENGDTTGISELGRFYYNGASGYLTQNYNLAYTYISKAAEMDDKYAQYYIAMMKYFGHGCPIDVEAAIEWFKKASHQDNDSYTEPMFKLGLLYLNELKPFVNPDTFFGEYGAPFVNVNESVKWLSLASKKGNIEASHKIAKMYKKGIHVKKDINKAMDFYRDAADRNDLNALFSLAKIYYEGKATTTLDDIDQAVEYLRILAEKNYIKAKIKLAEIYTRPFPKVTSSEDIGSDQVSTIDKYNANSTSIYKSKYFTKENILEAIKTLNQFYKSDDKAKTILGELLYKGIQVKEDTQLALKLLNEASKGGNSNSLLFLGRIFYKGKNVAKDKMLAINYLKQSAEKKNAKAANKLGKIYFLDGDYNECIYWFTQAAILGYHVAQYNLGVFYMENRGPKYPRKLSSGLEYLEIAATQNYLPALLKLGDYYYKGNYFNDEKFYYNIKVMQPNIHNLSIAVNYYKRAAELKSIRAMIKLGEIYERAIDYNYLVDRKEAKKLAINYYESAYKLGFGKFVKQNGEKIVFTDDKNMIFKDNDFVFPAVKLSLLKHRGEKISVIDGKTALAILRIASKNENAAALNCYGKIFLFPKNKNTKIDLENSQQIGVNFYQSASKLGSKKAKIHLALFYFVNKDYQKAFDYFNEVLLQYQNQSQNQDQKQNIHFDVDFQYDLKENDFDLYAAFFCQLLIVLGNALSINTSNCVINQIDLAKIGQYTHREDINSNFYEGLFEFNDFDNDTMHFQYYNNNGFDFDDSIMYKSFMRDCLCYNNNYNNFYNRLTEFIEIFRHDDEFLEYHSDIINKLSSIAYQRGNPRTILECAILLDSNCDVNNNISCYDCFTHSYKIDLETILNTNLAGFNHTEFAKSLYKLLIDKLSPNSLFRIRQVASLNYSNFLTKPFEKFAIIVPFAHLGVEYALRKVVEICPDFTNVLKNECIKHIIENDPDDDINDTGFRNKFNSIDFNKPDDRKNSKFSSCKINLIKSLRDS